MVEISIILEMILRSIVMLLCMHSGEMYEKLGKSILKYDIIR